jgi:anthranilate/para-aminobenzoate synthase component I
MKLGDIDNLPCFALLGPGFGDGRCFLLRNLRPAAHRRGCLVYMPFENTSALCFDADRLDEFEPEIAPNPAPSIELALFADNHARQVAIIREAIARGDVYQVCLTARALISPISGPELVSRMWKLGPPRYGAWVRLPDGQEFVSASPELFFETNGRHVHTEPMKGTAALDAKQRLELSDKDRSELAMITDLLRNDLAPVCIPKTVRVANERRVVELAYALQTVSDVVGTLQPHITPFDVLTQLHPGGSVTGAPKQAALAMIRELEDTPRGAYCGALGLWIDERSVFSLLIRTAVKSAQGWIYGVGGGIVYDSDPREEYEELKVKLGALR